MKYRHIRGRGCNRLLPLVPRPPAIANLAIHKEKNHVLYTISHRRMKVKWYFGHSVTPSVAALRVEPMMGSTCTQYERWQSSGSGICSLGAIEFWLGILQGFLQLWRLRPLTCSHALNGYVKNWLLDEVLSRKICRKELVSQCYEQYKTGE